MRRLVPVTAMYVKCSLQVRNIDTGYSAMSDCCQAPATSAVVLIQPHKNSYVRYWRCTMHKGIVAVDKSGNVVEYGDVATEIAKG